MSGKRRCRFNMVINRKKEKYEIDFNEMTQTNLISKGDRPIRPPYRMRAPDEAIRDADGERLKVGPTICIKVPEGSAGTTIQVPHPKAKGKFFEVKVPRDAQAGQAMIVPVPPWQGKMDPVREKFKAWDKNGDGVMSFAEMRALLLHLNPDWSSSQINAVLMAGDENEDFQIQCEEFVKILEGLPEAGGGGGGDVPAGGGGGWGAPAAAAEDPKPASGGGWSTGAKVAAGAGIAGGVLLVGGAVAGAIILADGDGIDGLGEALEDIGGDIGDAVTGAAEDVGDWLGGAAEDAGDFIMDLF